MKKSTLLITILAGGLALQSCGNKKQEASKQKDVFLNVTQFKGQNPDGVVKILGKPDTAFNKRILGKPYYIQLYQSYDSCQFRYQHNKLEGIIIHKPRSIAFSPNSIESFGLDYKKPTLLDTASTIMWKNYEGFKAINFYKVGTKARNPNGTTFKAYFNFK